MLILTIIFGVMMFVWMGVAINAIRGNEKRDEYIKELEGNLSVKQT